MTEGWKGQAKYPLAANFSSLYRYEVSIPLFLPLFQRFVILLVESFCFSNRGRLDLRSLLSGCRALWTGSCGLLDVSCMKGYNLVSLLGILGMSKNHLKI